MLTLILSRLWRPIVGIDAFDLREHEIDITPWLPLLCDGNPHNFEIRVAGLNDDGQNRATLSESVGSYWLVEGNIFIFLDKEGTVTTGTLPRIAADPPQIRISSTIGTNSTGANETLVYDTEVERLLTISSTVTTSRGSRSASWVQRLAYSNGNFLSSQGFVQTTNQSTTGTDEASSGYLNSYSYPLQVTSSFSVDSAGDVGINASLLRGLTYNVYGPSIFPSGIQNFNITSSSVASVSGRLSPQVIQLPNDLPLFSGSLLSTTQLGSAEYLSAGNRSYSFGTTSQDFEFKGAEINSPSATYELYRRHVKAVNSTVTEDEQVLAGRTFNIPTANPGPNPASTAYEGFSVRAVLGRGPGQGKGGLIGFGDIIGNAAAARNGNIGT